MIFIHYKKLKPGFYKDNNNDVVLLIRLKGLYYSDLYFKNKQADFYIILIIILEVKLILFVV